LNEVPSGLESPENITNRWTSRLGICLDRPNSVVIVAVALSNAAALVNSMLCMLFMGGLSRYSVEASPLGKREGAGWGLKHRVDDCGGMCRLVVAKAPRKNWSYRPEGESGIPGYRNA
jgi:hypothetical protein